MASLSSELPLLSSPSVDLHAETLFSFKIAIEELLVVLLRGNMSYSTSALSLDLVLDVSSIALAGSIYCMISGWFSTAGKFQAKYIPSSRLHVRDINFNITPLNLSMPTSLHNTWHFLKLYAFALTWSFSIMSIAIRLSRYLCSNIPASYYDKVVLR